MFEQSNIKSQLNTKEKFSLMKKINKTLILILFFTIYYAHGYDKNCKKSAKDTSYIEITHLQQINGNEHDLEYDKKLLNMNMQLLELQKNVADTKNSFYDSRIALHSFLITVIALIFIYLGFMGYKNVYGKVEENKTDLVKRIDDLKDDYRDFKKDANSQIEKGLDSEFSKAVQNIMKGSFGKNIDDMINRIEALEKNIIVNKNTDSSGSDGKSAESISSAPTTIQPESNAFDDEN